MRDVRQFQLVWRLWLKRKPAACVQIPDVSKHVDVNPMEDTILIGRHNFTEYHSLENIQGIQECDDYSCVNSTGGELAVVDLA